MSNKVMVISGGASGLGRAAAVKFAKNGYDVVIIDINENKGFAAVEEIEKMGQQAIFCHCDISNKQQVNAAGSATAEKFGRTDVLINNAGLEVRGSVLQCTEDDWTRLYDINLKGIYYMSNAFVPMIKEQSGGAVVNTGSILGYRTVGERAAYSSSKGAIDTLTR
ncbi:MAG: SDR family oxidoreductase, partial [Saprospiraceae bacterium]|nr:SDR family oxidoreductase [Saprospiraceae bacterium]